MKRHQYTEEEKQFLRDNILTHSYRELQKEFNAKYNLCLTLKSIEKTCRRIGVNHGHAGVVFEKGENNPFSPTLPIGSEIISAGKVYVKVSNKCFANGKSRVGDTGNFVQKNRYIYEQSYGPITAGYQIIALDKDRRNFSPDNLYAVPKKINMMMCLYKWFSTDREVTLAAIKWCELFYAMKGE